MEITFQVHIDRWYFKQVFRETLDGFSLSIKQNVAAPLIICTQHTFRVSAG